MTKAGEVNGWIQIGRVGVSGICRHRDNLNINSLVLINLYTSGPEPTLQVGDRIIVNKLSILSVN